MYTRLLLGRRWEDFNERKCKCEFKPLNKITNGIINHRYCRRVVKSSSVTLYQQVNGFNPPKKARTNKVNVVVASYKYSSNGKGGKKCLLQIVRVFISKVL